jgi:ABC-2 type transport system permease protein
MSVAKLVYKDWYFNRWAILSYTLTGLVAVALLALPSEGAFYAGSTLLITALIAIGIQLVMTSVVYERSEQTLAFVMSLPITARDYTAGKVIANLAIFSGAWSILTVSTVALIASRSAVPDGLIPLALVVLGQIFASYVLLLAVAIVSESMPWTIGAIITGNLLMQAVLYGVANSPRVKPTLETDTLTWPAPVPAVLLTQALLVAGLIAFTFAAQGRKKEFV